MGAAANAPLVLLKLIAWIPETRCRSRDPLKLMKAAEAVAPPGAAGSASGVRSQRSSGSGPGREPCSAVIVE